MRPAGDYAFLLSTQQKHNLEQLSQRLSQLQTCLQLSFPSTPIHIGTATSLEIYWETPKAQVVIELSLHGNLVTVFMYGEVPAIALPQIDGCLHTIGLIRLSDEKRRQLEDQGLYHEIF